MKTLDHTFRFQLGAWHYAQNSNMAEPLPGDELLQGADDIAAYLFGSPKFRRKVYYLVESGRLPVAKLGGYCARKSTLTAYLNQQEQAALSRKAVRAA